MSFDASLVVQAAVTLAGISATWAVTKREAEEARKEAKAAQEAAQEAIRAAGAATAIATEALKEAARATATASNEGGRANSMAAAAHTRIDAHTDRLSRLEEAARNSAEALKEIKGSLQALHQRLDAWFDGRPRPQGVST